MPRLDIFHSGHLHLHQAFVMLSPGSQCLHSAAGSSHETRHYRNSYNLIEYDIGNAVCRIRQFEYKTDSGGFQEMEGMEYRMPSAREFPAKAVDIANVLRENVEAAGPYADYMAALLTGDLDEVPISLDAGTVTFASRNFPSEYQFREVRDFLRISNLLRVYDVVPLNEMVSIHAAAISGLADLLKNVAARDSQFADMLANRATQAQRLCGMGVAEAPPYQEQYLDELARHGDIAELIDTATRYLKSLDEVVQVAAKRRLAWAFLQSEGHESRQEGLNLAFQNLDEVWANAEDYCVASAAAESLGDKKRAEHTALHALEIWTYDSQLRAYCRSFATQTGSQILRQRLDETGGT